MPKEWVEMDSLGGIETIIKNQTGQTGFLRYPFEVIEIKNAYDYTSRAVYDAGSGQDDGVEVLRLRHNSFFRADSGAAKFKVANNYKVEMVFISDNYDYFQDEILSGKEGYVEEMKNILTDSYLRVVLDGNTDDYVSIDVDGDHAGIGNFNMRVNGEFVFKDSPKMNNDCDIWIQRVWYYQEIDEPEPTEEERQDEAIEEYNEEYKSEPDVSTGGGGGDSGIDFTDWGIVGLAVVGFGAVILFGGIIRRALNE